MSVLDEVRKLVTRLSPEAICDDCTAEKLNLSVRQHANHKTRELAGEGGFERRRLQHLRIGKARRSPTLTTHCQQGNAAARLNSGFDWSWPLAAVRLWQLSEPFRPLA
ncbi:MAG TPA: hypothetical protein VJ846_06910 [Sphingomicrobium sp.]|nr:hypothetical protein [Sphingomicrobium sp.]